MENAKTNGIQAYLSLVTMATIYNYYIITKQNWSPV